MGGCEGCGEQREADKGEEFWREMGEGVWYARFGGGGLMFPI